MSSNAAARSPRWSDHNFSVPDATVVGHGREVVAIEARAVAGLADHLGEDFAAAVRLILQTGDAQGDLIVAGMGKAGHIGQKLAATFASTGTRAHFLHPAEAFHGDLGRVRSNDVVLFLSQSGETSEVLQLLPALRMTGASIVAMTATVDSSLGRAARVVLPIGRLNEACSLGLAPSTSTTVMLALGDALALTISRLRGFRDEDFAKFHPGGALGLKLSLVDDHMRPLAECRLASDDQSIRDVLVASTKPSRRSGAVILTNAAGRLTGLFTDSDLARLIEHRREAALDQPIRRFMEKSPTTVVSGERLTAAIKLLAGRKFSELPVVDHEGRPVGMIDVTDIVGLSPSTEEGVGECLRDSCNANATGIRIFSADDRGGDQRTPSPHVVEIPETD